jgi:hypothetical protein
LFSLDGDAVNYGFLNDSRQLFAGCLAVVLLLSLALFLLCRWRAWTAIISVIFTLAWVAFLLPDTQYYLATRDATPDSIVEPFYRANQIFGYIIVLLPVPFVVSGLYLRSRRTI